MGNSRLTFCEKYLSYLKEVQLGTLNDVRVDFHCGVKFTRVNQNRRGNVFTAEVVEKMYERARVNEKRETSTTFPFTFAQDTP